MHSYEWFAQGVGFFAFLVGITTFSIAMSCASNTNSLFIQPLLVCIFPDGRAFSRRCRRT